jgi:phosphate-selective porin OprO/OprP
MALYIVLVLVAVPFARADDGAAREAQLTELVQRLEGRLEQVEQELKVLKAQQPPPVAQASPAVAAPAGTSATPAPAAEPLPLDAARPLEAYWRDGLELRSSDGAFAIKVGGRIQLDTAFFDEDPQWAYLGEKFPDFGLKDEQDGLEFRRSRLSVGGTIYQDMAFRAEYDFAADSPGNDGGRFADVFLELKNLPYVGSLRLGHFQEPFTLEDMTSNRYLTYMERSLPNVFAPSFNVGAMARNAVLKERMTWSLGLFKTTDDWPSENDSSEQDGYAVTGRVTGLPWKSEDGSRYLHLGASFTQRNPDGAFRYSSRPEAHLAQAYLNTGVLHTSSLLAYGGEMLMVYGPASLQAEYVRADLDIERMGERHFDSYYISGSWFLTGEHRPYTAAEGVPGRLRPKHPFSLRDETRGWGAWEMALRYSWLDLNDGLVRGGEMSDWTFALNWYLNANTRMMVNYILAEPENDLHGGEVEILQTRFQVDF